MQIPSEKLKKKRKEKKKVDPKWDNANSVRNNNIKIEEYEEGKWIETGLKRGKRMDINFLVSANSTGFYIYWKSRLTIFLLKQNGLIVNESSYNKW